MLEYNKGKKGKMEYKIVVAGSAKQLEKLINEKYNEYKPSGGINITIGMGIKLFSQVVYKEKEK